MTPEIQKIEILNPSGVFLKSKSKTIVMRNRQLSMRRYFLQKKSTKILTDKKVVVFWKNKGFIFPNVIAAGEPALKRNYLEMLKTHRQ